MDGLFLVSSCLLSQLLKQKKSKLELYKEESGRALLELYLVSYVHIYSRKSISSLSDVSFFRPRSIVGGLARPSAGSCTWVTATPGNWI